MPPGPSRPHKAAKPPQEGDGGKVEARLRDPVCVTAMNFRGTNRSTKSELGEQYGCCTRRPGPPASELSQSVAVSVSVSGSDGDGRPRLNLKRGPPSFPLAAKEYGERRKLVTGTDCESYGAR
eukprot:3605188-Rhodomonas_salina.1